VERGLAQLARLPHAVAADRTVRERSRRGGVDLMRIEDRVAGDDRIGTRGMDRTDRAAAVREELRPGLDLHRLARDQVHVRAAGDVVRARAAMTVDLDVG